MKKIAIVIDEMSIGGIPKACVDFANQLKDYCTVVLLMKRDDGPMMSGLSKEITVSDSGTLPEESSFFTSIGHPFPAICIRTSTERPEALDKACFILSGIDEKGLLQSVDTAVELNKAGDYGIPVPDYIEENVSTKVVKIIQSYTGVVNKMVWRKDI